MIQSFASKQSTALFFGPKHPIQLCIVLLDCKSNYTPQKTKKVLSRFYETKDMITLVQEELDNFFSWFLYIFISNPMALYTTPSKRGDIHPPP